MTEFTEITTRRGDSGESSLSDGSRHPKDDLIFEVLGDVDELHSFLGLLKAGLNSEIETEEINWMEHRLLNIGAMTAVPISHPMYRSMELLEDVHIEELESRQKALMKNVEMPPLFITFGGSENGARADTARAVCRRTERHMVKLIREREMDHLGTALKFLNRLSDWLYIKARELDAAG